MNKREVLRALDIPDPFEGFRPVKESSIWGWNGDKPIFAQLIREKNPLLIVEVGSWLGMSTYTMGNTLKNIGSDAAIICVDTWLGSQEHWQNPDMRKHLELEHGFPTFYKSFLGNMLTNGLSDRVVPIPLPSLIAARWFKSIGLQADLIYVDGSHNEKDVYEDLCTYWELLAQGGFIFGDDWPWVSVSNAVKRFCEEKNLHLRLQDIDWVIKKV